MSKKGKKKVIQKKIIKPSGNVTIECMYPHPHLAKITVAPVGRDDVKTSFFFKLELLKGDAGGSFFCDNLLSFDFLVFEFVVGLCNCWIVSGGTPSDFGENTDGPLITSVFSVVLFFAFENITFVWLNH